MRRARARIYIRSRKKWPGNEATSVLDPRPSPGPSMIHCEQCTSTLRAQGEERRHWNKHIARAGGGEEALERSYANTRAKSSQLTFDHARLMLSTTPIPYCKRAALHLASFPGLPRGEKTHCLRMREHSGMHTSRKIVGVYILPGPLSVTLEGI